MALNPQTMTPGSAVAQTIQEILARRRGEEQQMMLTRMQMDETAETKRARAEQERMVREQFGLQQQQAEQNRLTNELQRQLTEEQLTQSQLNSVLRPGMLPDQIPNEALRQKGIDRGLFPILQPQGPTEDGGLLGPVQGAYQGTYEQQQQERARQVFGDAAGIAGMPAGPEKDAALQELAIRGTGEGIPQFVQQIFQKPDVQGGYVDPRKGFVAIPGLMVPPEHAVQATVGYPPQVPVGAMDRPRTYKIYDADTNKLVETKPNLTQAQLETYLTEQTTAGKRLYPVDILGKQPEAGVIPASMSPKIAAARAAFMQAAQAAKPGFFSFGADDKAAGVANAAGAQYSTMVGQAMAHVDAPQHVKDLANLIMSDPQVHNLPVQNAFRVLAERPETHPRRVGSKSGQISPDDAIAVQNLINLFQGLQTVPVPSAPIYQFAPTQ